MSKSKMYQVLTDEDIEKIKNHIRDGCTLVEISAMYKFEKPGTFRKYLIDAGYSPTEDLKERKRIRDILILTEIESGVPIMQAVRNHRGRYVGAVSTYVRNAGGAGVIRSLTRKDKMTNYDWEKMNEYIVNGKSLNSLYVKYGFPHRSSLVSYIKTRKKKETNERMYGKLE